MLVRVVRIKGHADDDVAGADAAGDGALLAILDFDDLLGGDDNVEIVEHLFGGRLRGDGEVVAEAGGADLGDDLTLRFLLLAGEGLEHIPLLGEVCHLRASDWGRLVENQVEHVFKDRVAQQDDDGQDDDKNDHHEGGFDQLAALGPIDALAFKGNVGEKLSNLLDHGVCRWDGRV